MINKIFWGMTEDAIRERVAEEARKYLGIKEGTNEHRRIVDIYNSQRKLPAGYRLQYNDPWCAAFVSFVGIVLDISDVILPECSCSRMIELYRKAGRWEERDDYNARIGDILMYDWQDDGKGDNTGAPDHVGFLIEKKGATWKIAEGNYDNSVKIRTIQRNQIRIRGWCLPDYAGLVHGYQDVPEGAWFRDAVQWADSKGIIAGIGGRHFAPKMGCNRAQVVTMLWRSGGSPKAENACPFSDVPKDEWYTEAVTWAAREGITEGIAADAFAPDSACNRAQIVTMLWRAAGRPIVKNRNHPFRDVPGDGWYSDAVEWAWRKGITIGCSDREFMPNSECNRAQLVEMIYRADKAA